jgi:hypothetical protein
VTDPKTGYDLARLWILRMTGFPVELIQELATPEWTNVADRAVAAGDALAAARSTLLDKLRELGKPARPLRKLVEASRPLPAGNDGAEERAYAAALVDAERTLAEADAALARALDHARERLYAFAASERFNHVLLLTSPALAGVSPAPGQPLPPRNSKARQRERTWMAYLQRLTTKNESVSFFGPTVWGTLAPELAAPIDIQLNDQEIDRRMVVFERWACLEICRLIEQDLADDAPAEAKSVQLPIGWPPLRTLRGVVAAIASPVKERWESRLDRIGELCTAMERATGLAERRAALDSISQLLDEWGARRGTTARKLYAGRMPVVEECRRAADVVRMGAPVIEQLTRDLAGWYELWRDLNGLYASRFFDELRKHYDRVAAGGPVRLSALFAAAAEGGIPLERTGGVGIVRGLEQKIQVAWSEVLGARAADREVVLGPVELEFLRRSFTFSRMLAFDWPAPDVQLIADEARLRDGTWELLLGEIHPTFAPLTVALFAYCPDPEVIAADLRHAGHPAALEFARDRAELSTAHIFSRAPSLLGNVTYLDTIRADGHPSIAADDVWVTLEPNDLVLRDGSGRKLGSLVHNWAGCSSTHQLEFVGTGTHSPRLRVGRVIVQRENWLVSPDDALRTELRAGGARAALAVRRLRQQHGMPEQLFARPVLPIRGTYHLAAKPTFVDLRNPLLVEQFADILLDHRQVRVHEMLPRLEDCWLADARGHYSSEFRLITRPAS